jgi:gas vesicle protein
MTEDTQDRRDYRFWIGLLAGTAVGAGLAMWVLPRASAELRQRMTTSASSLRTAASDRFREASARVDETVDELTKHGQALRHDAARTIVRGAHQAESLATAIEGGPIATVKS